MKFNKGFSLIEMLFWLAIVALIFGGVAYKSGRQLQKQPFGQNIQKEIQNTH